MSETIIDLLRHGEPIGGARYRGNSVDDPLSVTGWAQMWDYVADQAPWSRVITSPMQRCCAFAEALAGRHGLSVHIEFDLREIGMGDWEGKTKQSLMRDEPLALNKFWADPINARPNGAEPLNAFLERVCGTIERAVKLYSGEHLLMIAHAGVVRAATIFALGSPLMSWSRIHVDYAGVCRLKHSRERGFQLIFSGVHTRSRTL